MKRSIFFALVAISLPSLLLSAEPSAFGAGDINNPTPYGLTSNEQTLLENQKKLHKVVVKSNNQANEVDSLRERIDGLQSIIESLSEQARSNKLTLKSLTKQNNDELNNNGEFNKRLTDAIKKSNDVIIVNANEIKKINSIVLEMSKLIDSINSNYVTKSEFNDLVNDVNKFKDLVIKELKETPKQTVSELENMSSAEIEKKARLFYDNKLYTKSLKYYKYLISQSYKPARSHYMVGEMQYYRKNYAEAIAYYKKSAKLYPKASYMSVLMLHTAVAMEKTGDKKNATTFYNAIISKYPNSSYAKTAKEKLNLIK